jgi:putative peptide zinc metalloprotease protein
LIETRTESATAPRLRRDLVMSRQGPAESVVWVVKDPVTGRFFRFRQIEACILDLLDGATRLETIRQCVEAQFHSPLPAATLEQFIARLRVLGLLEEAAPEAERIAPGRRRLGGDILYLRWRLFDPDRLFDRLVKRLRFLFTPQFLVLSAALIVIAAGVTVLNWADIVRGFRRLYRVEGFALAYLTMLVVITAHEFAHGLTCKRFGGKVHELGCMLLYFQPAFYCNVSDAWLFPSKTRRLWVTFAGAYFELFVWAIATLVWRVTDPDTVLNYAASVVTLTSGVKTLFNLNPLIKLDGYYLLSDWLDVPNLRRRAFGYLNRLMLTRRMRDAGVTPRERRIYLVYGLLAATYSYWLLGWLALWFGGRMVRSYQAWGFVGYVGLLTAVFRRPLYRAVSTVRGMQVPNKRAIKWFAALAIGLVALYFGRIELKVSGEFTVLPVRNADVRSEIEGLIEEVRVDEGDFVNKGDVVARLSSRDYTAELRKVKADIDEKQARLRLLKAGPRAEEVDLAKTTVEKESERLKYSRERFDLYKVLLDESLVSHKEFVEVEEEVAVRKQEYGEATGKLKVLLAGSRPEEIEEIEAGIARFAAQQRYLEGQIQRVELVSPIAGVITTPKLKERIGEHVAKGDLITKVHDLRTVLAEISVSEKEISDVRVGQPVILKARAFPQQSFAGKVTAVAPTVSPTQEWKTATGAKTVTVRTQIDNPQLLLKTDMTGTAKVYCGKRRALDLLTRRLARYIRVEFWSWW